MPWMVVVDQEAMDLLDAAAEMAAAALAARSRRVDEDGVIKRSVDMSRIKLETLRSSLHQPPLAEYSEIAVDEREKILALFRMFLDTPEVGGRAAIWRTLRAYVLRPGSQEPFAGGSQPWGDGDLSVPPMASDPAGSAEKPSAVRGRMRKPRDGNSSP